MICRRHDVRDDVLQDHAAPRAPSACTASTYTCSFTDKAADRTTRATRGMTGSRSRSHVLHAGPGSRRWRAPGSAGETPAGCPSAARAADRPARPERADHAQQGADGAAEERRGEADEEAMRAPNMIRLSTSRRTRRCRTSARRSAHELLPVVADVRSYGARAPRERQPIIPE